MRWCVSVPSRARGGGRGGEGEGGGGTVHTTKKTAVVGSFMVCVYIGPVHKKKMFDIYMYINTHFGYEIPGIYSAHELNRYVQQQR